MRWVHNIHLWLEDMDTFAADVAALHADYHDGTKGLVTAFMDELCWVKHDVMDPVGGQQSKLPPPRVDMQLSGQVTWVGKSSMEVTLELHECGPSSSSSSDLGGSASGTTTSTTSGGTSEGQNSTLVALSRFVMAARTSDFKKSCAVDALVASSPSEEALFNLGALHQQDRLDR
eukprot:gene9930-7800_t